MNSFLVEFADGMKVVTSRHYVTEAHVITSAGTPGEFPSVVQWLTDELTTARETIKRLNRFCQLSQASLDESVALRHELAEALPLLRAVDGWRRAALLKDRTRRAIRERYRAGERVQSLADEFMVPETFIEALCAWQMFGDK